MKKREIEILAPVGSEEALTAAVRCGAAAVYFGAGDMNARQGAYRFIGENLVRAVEYCHVRGVQVHLTLNTLVREEELDKAVGFAKEACKAGVDALIVQDVGLARCLRSVMPEMPLHASTQLSCHSPAGVDFLREAGFSRVVLSREMTREEIKACLNRGVEIEVFVHGALCMSVSGQCYFSAMLGGRSGNRGLCAQTCRLPFAPTKDRPIPAREETALSLKDNCLVAYVRELAQMGVASLKIEGRLKRPEYVGAATAVYVAAAQGKPVVQEDIERLKNIFSRSGFTDGYYTDRRGAEMFGARRYEDVTASTSALLGEVSRSYALENPLIPVSMYFYASPEASSLQVTDEDGNTTTVTQRGTEKALHRPMDTGRITEQLQKTGGTPYYATAVTVDFPSEDTIPLSVINDLRRRGLDALSQQRALRKPRFADGLIPAGLPRAVSPKTPVNYYRVARIEQVSPLMKDGVVFLPLSTPTQTLSSLQEQGFTLGADIPRGLFGMEETVEKELDRLRLHGVTVALCGNVGAIPLARKFSLEAVGGFGLNITNTQALALMQEQGLSRATVSFELTFGQMKALTSTAFPVGLLVYGRQPLMLTRNCPRSCSAGGCSGCHGQGITDRTGTVFPVMCVSGCSEVLNSVPLYWGDCPEALPSVDFHLFHFTTESPMETQQVLEAYRRHLPAPGNITRGLYRRGVQ